MLAALISAWTALVLLLIGCGQSNQISGEVFWEGGGVELPVGAEIRVVLADVSLQDVAWTVIAEQTIGDPGALPHRFRLFFDSEAIGERNRYSLSARIELDGDLLYINDTTHPVLTYGAPRSRDIELIAVR